MKFSKHAKSKVIKIVPKLVLLATLIPSVHATAQLRNESKNVIDFLQEKQNSMNEEFQIHLACSFTCGASCSHTDNC